MSSALIDFLRSEGVDEGVGDVEGEEGGEKLRFNIFNDNYTAVEPDPEADEAPVTGSWVLPTLYKLGADEAIHSYQIGYNDVSKKVLWVTGRIDTGGMTLHNTDIVPTRAQKGSFQKKAWVEAMNRYNLKIKGGFSRETSGTSTMVIPHPMLANRYEPPTEGSAGNVPEMPVAAQAKFDGERHLVYMDPKSGEVKQLSRLMNPRPYFEHISGECERLLEFLPPGTILDGELYSDRVNFQEITEIAGTKKGKHKREKELDYYVFDLYHPTTVWVPGISKELAKAEAGIGDREEDKIYVRASGYTVEDYTTEAREYYELPHDDEGDKSLTCHNYAELLEDNPMWVVEVRVMLLMNAFRCYRAKYKEYPRHVKLVKTYILHQREDIAKLFGEMRHLNKDGKEQLEGIMLRHLSRGDMDPTKSLYRPGRSNNLLKVKALMTTEVLVTGVKAGKGRDKDLAILLYKEPDTGLSGSVVMGKHDERRRWLLDPSQVKGRTLTVSFQNRMKSGALRFPTGVAFVN